jgi:hypothetical protein
MAGIWDYYTYTVSKEVCDDLVGYMPLLVDIVIDKNVG